MVLLLCTSSFSTSIHIEWGYTPPIEPKVTGFTLYQTGSKVCFFPGDTVSSGDCSVTLISKNTDFTLTANFSDGTESPHSAPFTFSVDVVPTKIQVTVYQEGVPQ